MPAAVGAAILSAFGAATWTALTIQVLVYSAASFALTKVINALMPRRKTGETRGMEASVTDSSADGRVLYGEARVSGINVIPPWTSGDNNRYLHQVLAVAVHEVDSYSDVYFDQETISNAAIGAVTSSANDGKVTGGKYNNAAWIRRYLGTASQTVDFILNAAFSGTWTADARGRGIAYVALQYDYGDGKVYSGIPQVTFKVKGKKCYDPRLDTSPGANPTNAAYAAWTTNPALCWADYKTAAYGRNVPAADIDWPSVVTAANECEELVAIPGTTQKRYTCNGILLANNDPNDNEKKLLDAMMGRMVYIRGKWTVYAGSWQTPQTVIDKADWSALGAIQTTASRDGGRFNGVRVYHIDPERNWQRVECFPRFSDTYRTADNNERIWLEMEQPLCTNAFEAQRKAELLLRASRNGVRVTGTLPPRFMLLAPWETVSLNFDELGWVSKTFRIVTTTPNPDGSIEVSMVEEQTGDWADMATGEYGNPSVATLPTANPTSPSAPRNLLIEPQPGLLRFDWDEPVVKPEGTRYRVLAAAGSYVDPASRAVIFDGVATDALYPILNTSSRQFYQVQAYAGSYFSDYTPNTFGIGAAPLFGGTEKRAVRGTWVNTGQTQGNSMQARLEGFRTRGGELRVQFDYTVVGSIAVTMADVQSWPGLNPSSQTIPGSATGGIVFGLYRRVDSGAYLEAPVNTAFAWELVDHSGTGKLGANPLTVWWGLVRDGKILPPGYPSSSAAPMHFGIFTVVDEIVTPGAVIAKKEYIERPLITSAFYEYKAGPYEFRSDNRYPDSAEFSKVFSYVKAYALNGSHSGLSNIVINETINLTALEALGVPSDAPVSGQDFVRKNGAWVAAASSGAGIADAPSDSVPYLRRNAAWVNANSYITGIGSGFADASSDGNLYARKNNAWSNINSLADAAPKAVGSGSLWAQYNGSWTNISSLSSTVPDAVGSGTLFARYNNSWTNINSLRSAVMDASSNGQVVARLNNSWVPVGSYFLPTTWDASSNGALMARLNNTWARVGSYFLSDASSDGKIYGRLNGAWYDITSFALADAPLNSLYYTRYNGQWVSIGSAASVLGQAAAFITTGGVSTPSFVHFEARSRFIDYSLGPTGAATKAPEPLGRMGFQVWNYDRVLHYGASAASGTVVDVSVGQHSDTWVFNSGSEYISVGDPVAVNSQTFPGIWQDGILTVSLADAMSSMRSRVIGVAAQDIPVYGTGFVRQKGRLEWFVNTKNALLYGYDAARTIYLGTTPGTLTNTIPAAPARIVRVGYGARPYALSSSGGLTGFANFIVDIQEGDALTRNTHTSSAADKSVLMYSASADLWEDRSLNFSDLPMQTGRLLGRTSANTGGAETITVGTGLQLSGGVLSATGGGGGGGGGTSKVLVQSLDIGSQPGVQGAFTYTEVPNVCARGLASRILIGIAGNIQPLFDVEVRNAGSSSGDLFLRAIGVTDARYEASIPFYYENDASQSVFVGIRNRASSTASFNLNMLRVEKFA